MGKREGGW